MKKVTPGSILKNINMGIVFILMAVQVSAQQAANIRVLLVTGGHGFDKEPFYNMVGSLPGISYKEVTHPDALVMFKPENRNLYDVILLYDMPNEISEQEKKDFTGCLQQGKGLVVLHHAYCSYQDWPEYQVIIGGRYHEKEWKDDKGKTHPASTYQHDVPFRVHVADKKHPVTKGIKDFDILDEIYGGGTVNPGVHVLLSTTQEGSTPSIAWTNRYGRSDVVTILLGHDKQCWQNSSFTRLLTQSVRWVKK